MRLALEHGLSQSSAGPWCCCMNIGVIYNPPYRVRVGRQGQWCCAGSLSDVSAQNRNRKAQNGVARWIRLLCGAVEPAG